MGTYSKARAMTEATIGSSRLELFLQSVQRQRDDTEFMRQLAWTLWIVVLFMFPITLIRQHADMRVEKAEEQVQVGAHYAGIVAACMSGKQFLWQDPHTGSDYAAFCNVVELGKVGR